jgi:hypothetical protein
LDLQELVAQLRIHERLVVTLALLRQVLVVQLARQVLLQLVQVVQLVVQRAQAQLLVVVPLELEVHPCLQKKIGVQKKLVQKNLKQPENLAYLF